MKTITISKEAMEVKYHPFVQTNIDKHFIGCVASGDLYSEPCELFRKDISELSPDALRKLEGVW